MIYEIKMVKCDICHREERQDSKGWLHQVIPVVFHTEQNEGTGTEPYLDSGYVDMCPECKKRFMEMYPLHGWGAQGYNTFKWKEEK